jgi:G3E family GTPase
MKRSIPSHIPTHLIAGPLGAGKTSLIRALLAQRPAGERWAVLINEFGQIGLDAALLSTDDEGIAFAEIAGGCLCCVNGVPFQVGLGRLLRKACPDRLLIEPSGLGHPGQLLTQLAAAPWQGVLALQPCVVVLDAPALLQGEPLPDSQQQAIAAAGLLVLNKSESLNAQQRLALAQRLAPRRLHWTSHGQLPIELLPGIDQTAGVPSPAAAVPQGAAPAGGVWHDPQQPICQTQAGDEAWSIGWRWHPSQRFDCDALLGWLGALPWRRAKLVLHGEHGWQAANALEGAAPLFTGSEWRRDSRIELIFAEPQNEQALTRTLAACRL